MGYPRFAAFIAHDEDKPTTIYRRFERLAARNLLYLESRLVELQATMDQMDRENLTADNLANGAKSWDEFQRLKDQTMARKGFSWQLNPRSYRINIVRHLWVVCRCYN